MKKFMLLITGTVVLATMAFAQAPAEPAKDAPATAAKEATQPPVQKDYKKERADWEQKMKTELKLTGEQAVKFEALNKEYNEKIDAIAGDANLAKEVQKEKKMALKKEKEAKLLEFLNEEQRARYNELIQEKKKSMGAKPSN